MADDDEAALGYARTLAALLSEQGRSRRICRGRDLSGVLPESARRAYDVHQDTSRLLDDPGIELHPKWAPNIVTVLGRIAGRTVGAIANNPMRLGGCLDSASAEKAARFVRFCDAFGVPLVVLVDVPGYLPGVGQEWDGVVRRGAKLLHAFAEATVPRVTLVTRKAYGGAYIAMNSRSLGATKVFAWPGPRSRSWARSPRCASCTSGGWPPSRGAAARRRAGLAAQHSATSAAWTVPWRSASSTRSSPRRERLRRSRRRSARPRTPRRPHNIPLRPP